MQHQVPQFIEIEDKIFGPLTFKQFLYLIGGGGASFLLWKILPSFLAILVSAPIIALSVALAFFKMNNRPFIEVVESAFQFFMGGKLYIWKKEPKKQEGGVVVENQTDSLYIPRLSDSKLKDIAWSLGVKNSMYAEEVESKKTEF
ncbi:hypothetical protein COW81_00255 [Candidatus Campbellbacteria bacterium CG22_combo_CG10-13_8_21_14_all_36_13]|uniref:PrgI family protein n=1 Tax=Candidatus Campbellbacteria bacterium CG22_combo_CG10-13_8_21_14_all_36_13 TaxID=1974529 RepID=A0A2H0DZN9_9BACT|nr:MAG: hypothetical protein COW81_00255 [Candidatus Campbellbacteria bacterium CG22_combo_CG10-13_8_21_14_all_36_13]